MKTLAINSQAIAANDNRLRGGSYSPEAFAARRRLKRSGFPLVSLGSSRVADNIFYPSRFKRTYVSADFGVEFLSSSEVLFVAPTSGRFISKRLTRKLDSYRVQPGWVLVTRSGTVGNVTIATQDFEGKAISEHVIRVIPAEAACTGHLYAFLSSKPGYALIQGLIFGSVVDEIEPEHLASLPVPQMPLAVQEHIHELVMTACDLRVQANAELRLADERFHQANDLPRLTKPTDERQVLAISSASFDNRLDGSYHNPQAQLAVANIRFDAKDCNPLCQLATTYLPTRFARVYVDDPRYGVPFLSSKQILQAEPTGAPYISRRLTRNLANYLVEEGWTLLTRSGTVGRVAFVSQDMAGSAISEHVIRIIPGEDISPGYLYAAVANEYGYYQTTRHIHGSVVDELTADQTDTILIPLPDSADEAEIGELVLDAMEKRVRANALLRRARTLFDAALTAGQATFTKTDPADWLASRKKDAAGAQA